MFRAHRASWLLQGLSWVENFCSWPTQRQAGSSAGLGLSPSAPRAQARIVSLRCRVIPSSPSFFMLFRCLHILPLHIIPHPPYTYTNSFAELGPAKEPAPKIHSHWGHSPTSSLMDASWSWGSQGGSLQHIPGAEGASSGAD